jgi:hypothetical protein
MRQKFKGTEGANVEAEAIQRCCRLVAEDSGQTKPGIVQYLRFTLAIYI